MIAITFQLTPGSDVFAVLNRAGRTRETPEESTAAPVIITKKEKERSYSQGIGISSWT